MNGAQEAADIVKSTAERAAEYWPEAVAGAQTYARDTQKALEKMPNQGLVIGTSFSLGLGVGLFMSGANRLLVLLSLAPAAAMAATLLSRNEPES
jgi:pantoate kinase